MSVFSSMLNNTFTVSRATRATDGQGGWPETFASVGTVLGRIRPVLSNERVVADSEEQQISHVLYVVAAEDVERGDVITVGSLEVEVLGVREPSLAGEHWEIDCLERQD